MLVNELMALNGVKHLRFKSYQKYQDKSLDILKLPTVELVKISDFIVCCFKEQFLKEVLRFPFLMDRMMQDLGYEHHDCFKYLNVWSEKLIALNVLRCLCSVCTPRFLK
jgi:hypothetical protein